MSKNRNARDKAPLNLSEEESETLVKELMDRGISRAKIGGFDIDGVLRGKYVALSKLRSALSHGFGFCDVIFGWDVADALYDNVELTGWHTGYPDAHAVIDPTTLRHIPWEPGAVCSACGIQGHGRQSASSLPSLPAETSG